MRRAARARSHLRAPEESATDAALALDRVYKPRRVRARRLALAQPLRALLLASYHSSLLPRVELDVQKLALHTKGDADEEHDLQFVNQLNLRWLQA